MSKLTLGLLNFADDTYLLSAQEGIKESARKLNARLLSLTTHNKNLSITSEWVRKFFPLDQRQVGGLILGFPSENFIELAHRFAREHFPVVLIGREAPGLACVMPDNRMGILQAVHHLVDHGHKRIVFIAGPQRNISARQRFQAFTEGLEAHGIRFDADLLITGNFWRPDAETAMANLLGRTRNFTAVLAASDEMAIGAIEALKKQGIKVPQDVAVVGFDDKKHARWTDPPLTTVQMPGFSMGIRAMDLLIHQIREGKIIPCVEKLPVHLLIRQSCGCEIGALEKNRITPNGDAEDTVSELAHVLSSNTEEGVQKNLFRQIRALIHSATRDEFIGLFMDLVHELTVQDLVPEKWRMSLNILKRDQELLFSKSPIKKDFEVICSRLSAQISEFEALKYVSLREQERLFGLQLRRMRDQLANPVNEYELLALLRYWLTILSPSLHGMLMVEHDSAGKTHWKLVDWHQQSQISSPFESREVPLWEENFFDVLPSDIPDSIALFLLTAQQEDLGVLIFDMDHPNLDLMTNVTADLSLALKATQLFRNLKQKAQDLERTNAELEVEMRGRARSEEALRLNEKRFRSLIENASDLITIIDQNGTILYQSPASTMILGVMPSNYIKDLIFRHIHPDDQEDFRTGLEKARSRPESLFMNEFRFRHQDGSWRILEVQGHNLLDDSAVGGIVLNSRDITDKKRLDEELLKARKLEAIGTLAGGIAHDFNNLLTAIMGNISLAQLNIDSSNPSARIMAAAENACYRARDLTQQFLTFSKGGAPILKTAALGEVVRESIQFVLRGSPVKAEMSIAPNLWPIEMDVGQINQVLNNLVINAVEAMPRGGKIEVDCNNHINSLDTPGVPLPAGRFVKLVIRDHGIGIPPQNLSRIFDPFFSTKPTGNGLGLATTFSIVRKHHGHIAVESTVGVGTAFTLYFPASNEVLKEEAREEFKFKPRKGNVLLLDDEPFVLEAATGLLKFIGFEVDCVQTGEEMLEKYQRSLSGNKLYDLVILDLTVPGAMGGKEAVQKLRQLNPMVKAIVSSGYSNDPVMANFREYGFDGMVAKPYQMENLYRCLDGVLNGST